MLSVGVDIGTYSIKVADLEATSKGYVVRRVAEYPLSLDLTKDRKIEIIDTLRTLFATYDLDQTHFIFSVASKHVSARLLNFPFRERFKVQKSVASQLEDELPFATEEAIFDTKTIRYAQKASDVLALAVPKERIADVLDLAQDCGVQPTLISTDSLGLSNLFEPWNQAPPDTGSPNPDLPSARAGEIVLNLGHTSTQLLVYSDQLLTAVRQIDWGGKNIADALAQKYGLNYIQSLHELKAKGFILLDRQQATREQIAFSEVIESSVQTLISELRLKLLELESEFNLQWTKGSLTGGTSQLRNLGAFLTQHFQFPFNRFRQFESQGVSFDIDAGLEAVSPVAVGLGLEGIKRPRNPAVNFLKDDFAQQSHFFESAWEKWGYSAKLLIVAFVIFTVYAIIRDGLTSTLVEKSDEVLRKQAHAIAGIAEKQATPDKVRKFISAQEQMEKSRKQAEKVVKINSPLDVLDMITGQLPSRDKINLEIKWVEVDNESADIAGWAGSVSERDQLQKILQKVSRNGRADVIDMKHLAVPAGKTGFSYRIQVNRFAGG